MEGEWGGAVQGCKTKVQRARSEQTGYYTSQGTSDAVSRVLQEVVSLAQRYLRAEGGWS